MQITIIIDLVYDELEEMSSKQLGWSLLSGTITGIIAVLVFKLLENKVAVGGEIRDATAEQVSRVELMGRSASDCGRQK